MENVRLMLRVPVIDLLPASQNATKNLNNATIKFNKEVKIIISVYAA